MQGFGGLGHPDRHGGIHGVVAGFLGEAEKGFDGGDYPLPASVGNIVPEPHIQGHHVIGYAFPQGSLHDLGKQIQIRSVCPEGMGAGEPTEPPADQRGIVLRPGEGMGAISDIGDVGDMGDGGCRGLEQVSYLNIALTRLPFH